MTQRLRGVCAARTVQAERNGARSNSLTKVRVWRCIAEAPPVGFALVRRDSANHASMLALAALSVLAPFSGTKVQRILLIIVTPPLNNVKRV